jgi:hypothetical protein
MKELNDEKQSLNKDVEYLDFQLQMHPIFPDPDDDPPDDYSAVPCYLLPSLRRKPFQTPGKLLLSKNQRGGGAAQKRLAVVVRQHSIDDNQIHENTGVNQALLEARRLYHRFEEEKIQEDKLKQSYANMSSSQSSCSMQKRDHANHINGIKLAPLEGGGASRRQPSAYALSLFEVYKKEPAMKLKPLTELNQTATNHFSSIVSHCANDEDKKKNIMMHHNYNSRGAQKACGQRVLTPPPVLTKTTLFTAAS